MQTYKATVKYQKMSAEQRFISSIGTCVLSGEFVEVAKVKVEAVDVFEACEMVWGRMNQLDVPPGHPDRKAFESIGHTAMSVGDIIEMEGHEGVYYCHPSGFVNLNALEQASAMEVK